MKSLDLAVFTSHRYTFLFALIPSGVHFVGTNGTTRDHLNFLWHFSDEHAPLRPENESLDELVDMFPQISICAHQLFSTRVAACQLLGPLTVFFKTADPTSGGQWGALFWTGSTFLYAFLDPHNSEDQMAPFVFKENSYGISTFDIKIYTV